MGKAPPAFPCETLAPSQAAKLEASTTAKPRPVIYMAQETQVRDCEETALKEEATEGIRFKI